MTEPSNKPDDRPRKPDPDPGADSAPGADSKSAANSDAKSAANSDSTDGPAGPSADDPAARSSERPEWLLDVERDVLDRLDGRPLDFASMHAISNIYRAAAAVRRRAEREVLADYGLTWGGFTILWVLWVWGEMETAKLASECGLAKGTLTGMLTTLGKRDLVVRNQVESDKRRVLVALTDTGTDTIDELFPKFNAYETTMTDGLTSDERTQLARLLSIVIGNAQ